MGKAEFDYVAVKELCDVLLNEYSDMKRSVKHFEAVLARYNDQLSDNIMEVSQEALRNINENMERINRYITKVAEAKGDAAVRIRQIENDTKRRVTKIAK